MGLRHAPWDLYTLSPPNNGVALSDNVIGNVVQRAGASRSRLTGGALNRKEDVEEVSPYKHRPQRKTNRQTPYKKATAKAYINFPEEGANARGEESPANTPLISMASFEELADAQTSRRYQTFRPSDLETANRLIKSIQAAEHPITAKMQVVIVAEALKQKIKKRESCRASQARYRNKQRVQTKITELQFEIKELELRRLEPSRPPTVNQRTSVPSIWGFAQMYFRHLHHFVASPTHQQTAATNFLREILAPAVADGVYFGAEAHMENWRLFALYFDHIDLTLKGLNMPSPDALVAGISITVTINNNTLRYAFPHLDSDRSYEADGDVRSPLAARLLGQRLVMHGSVVFGWDNSSEQVARLQTRFDLLTPLLKLLGNSLEDVSCVFDKAMVTPECQFVRR